VPIITFVNKVDREGREVFAILDEVAELLQLDVTPMTWPVGMGGQFEGIYDLANHRLLLPEGDSREFQGKVIQVSGLDDSQLDAILSAEGLAKLREDVELAGVGYPEFDGEAYRGGDLTPVYFGSALKEFGVDSLIDAIATHAPSPRTQPAEPAPVSPDRDEVTGFVFKVQANMDPNHRDRIAFMRLVSGVFKRGMKLTPTGHGKPIAIHSPILFFARERELADEAYPGDIIGIPNHGVLRVGDTLSERADVRFTGLPNFAPEILRRVVLKDPTKTKQLRKALDDMAEEGVTQVFYPDIGSNWIIGVVGQLQLDVLLSRLDAEYKVAAGLEIAPFETARWVSSEDPADLKAFMELNRGAMAKDRDGNPVFMAKSAWEVGYITDRYTKVKFAATRER
jgi:peptide chain release factor 3